MGWPGRSRDRVRLHPGRIGVMKVAVKWASRTVAPKRMTQPAAANLPLFSCHLQLPIPPGVDLPLTPGEHVLRGETLRQNGLNRFGWILPVQECEPIPALVLERPVDTQWRKR